MKSKLVVLTWIICEGLARAEDNSRLAVPGMAVTGSLARQQIVRKLQENRQAFDSCHKALKVRFGKKKDVVTFEQAREVESKNMKDKTIQPDGVHDSTTFVKPTNPPPVSISGEVVLHFSIKADGSTSEARVGRSDIEEPLFKNCLEKSIANQTFPTSAAATKVAFLILNFSVDGYQSKD